jgi:hypothetical protein
MNKLEEIFNAWIISNKPTDDFIELAKKRIEICNSCEFKKDIIKNKKWSFYCSECTCPINKKIFSPKHNPCPKSKWGNVDDEYLFLYKDKTDKSLF